MSNQRWVNNTTYDTPAVAAKRRAELLRTREKLAQAAQAIGGGHTYNLTRTDDADEDIRRYQAELDRRFP